MQTDKQVLTAGTPVTEAKKAMVMLHGRGATAAGIINLANHFLLKDTAIFAPQAAGNTWYPYSFMVPVEDNEPSLSRSLGVIDDLVNDIIEQGVSTENIYFLGFSQGACLALEYVARHPARYAGVIAFTGGLIGEKIDTENYKGDFAAMPILITTGDPDPHGPLSRVEESKVILENLHANVILKVYKGRPHTIIEEELSLAKQYVLNL